jgi:hypothetical protein
MPTWTVGSCINAQICSAVPPWLFCKTNPATRCRSHHCSDFSLFLCSPSSPLPAEWWTEAVWIAKLAPAGLQHLLPSSLPLLLDLEKARTHGLFLLLPFFSSCCRSGKNFGCVFSWKMLSISDPKCSFYCDRFVQKYLYYVDSKFIWKRAHGLVRSDLVLQPWVSSLPISALLQEFPHCTGLTI